MIAVRVAVLGTGYVGLTTSACLAELGWTVTGCDVDPMRIASLSAGRVPFHEPGLAELLDRHLGRRLRFTAHLPEAAGPADVIFICVGTPPRRDGSPDLTALEGLTLDLMATLRGHKLLVTKSTVPVGTNRRIATLLGQVPGLRAQVLANPEFLREGAAVHDFMHPDRIVIGGPREAAAPLLDLYRLLDAPVVCTTWEAAELIKYAANAHLAMRISFINELSVLCEALGVDVLEVSRGIGLDQRIGPHFLLPGPGYGGSCLPKDLGALRWLGKRAGVGLPLLGAVAAVNRGQRLRILDKLREALGGNLLDKQIGVWGLAFKAGTSDLRGAPALDLLPRLSRAGARVRAHDPRALGEARSWLRRRRLRGVALVSDQWAAVDGADALLILTEWPDYRVPPAEIRRHLHGDAVVDARNLLEPDAARRAGLRYWGVGRGTEPPG